MGPQFEDFYQPSQYPIQRYILTEKHVGVNLPPNFQAVVVEVEKFFTHYLSNLLKKVTYTKVLCK
jgi:hypothetical protein